MDQSTVIDGLGGGVKGTAQKSILGERGDDNFEGADKFCQNHFQ